MDQPCHALVTDLEQRGLLDETLVIWGGEFRRTIYSQGGLSKENYGRDHHPRCFSMWMAGGGFRPGHVHGETDDFSYNVVKDPVNVHELPAPPPHGPAPRRLRAAPNAVSPRPLSSALLTGDPARGQGPP